MFSLRKYKKYFVDPYYSFGNILCNLCPGLMPDKYYLKCKWKSLFGYNLDLKHPKTLNEKIQWLKIHDRNPLFTILADKNAVKQWISDNLDPSLVIPTYQVCSRVEDLDWDTFPESFVLKCTHDSGSTIICRNTGIFNREEACVRLRQHLAHNFYEWGREWPYKNVPHRIICEKLLLKSDGTIPNDYKLHYINGSLEFVYVSYDREGVNDRCIYNQNWQRLPFVWVDPSVYRDTINTSDVPCPATFEKMKEYGDKVARLFWYVRVDFYDVDGRLYLGEITLYHGSGYDKFFPDYYDLYYGNKLILD